MMRRYIHFSCVASWQLWLAEEMKVAAEEMTVVAEEMPLGGMRIGQLLAEDISDSCR